MAAIGGLFGGGHDGHGGHSGPDIAGAVPLLTLGLGLLLLMHSAVSRSFARRVVSLVARAIRDLIFRIPAWLPTVPVVARVLESRPFSLALQLLIKPAVYTALVGLAGGLLGLAPFATRTRTIVLFLVVGLVANSRPGRRGEEIVLDCLARNWHFVRVRIVAGLLRAIVQLFQSIVERLDRVLYRVDEFLRFRSGEGRLRLVVKGALSTVWFLGSYLIRTMINLFIEPQINPIKHFPVVTVSHKILLPALPKITEFLARPFSPLIGTVAAKGIMGSAVFLMPGVFGFLVWELKENWRLFAANRPRTLRPIRVGSHGETMVRLLRPGFHWGTIPKAYARIRRAERTARESRSARTRMRGVAALEHVELAVRRFAERDFTALLRESGGFGGKTISVRGVELASNRIAVEIDREGADDLLRIAFDEDSGWMVAGLVKGGWACRLYGCDRAIMENALVGFYRLSGVEIVREELDRRLRGAPYDITDEGLVVWSDATYDRELWFRLPRREGLLGGDRVLPRPELSLRFPCTHIAWRDWVEVWSGAGPNGIGSRLRPELSVLPPSRPTETGTRRPGNPDASGPVL